MRLHRFYTNFPLEHTKVVVKDENLIHQWRNIFRYNVGSEVVLFDGSGKEYQSVIEKMNNREAEVRLVRERKGVLPDRNIVLYQSLIKKDKMEWIVEKVTELGVLEIVPVVSERSEKKGFNTERARKIAIEASEQCGRANVPRMGEIVDLEQAIEMAENIFVFDASGEYAPSSLSEGEDKLEISIFIGPEGGWSPKELLLFKEKNAQIFSLGKLTLRAETAAIVALAKFL